MQKIIDILFRAVVIALAMLVIFITARVFVCDRFRIKGKSMTPTLVQGKYVYVNKLLMGARIYKSFDFDTPELKCFRMPGLRNLRAGDIAVFNYPYGWEKDEIGFKINYVYAKRCIAAPRDTLWIENGFFRNSNTMDIGVPLDAQKTLSSLSDEEIENYRVAMRAFAFAGSAVKWTIRDFGPLYIPGKGDEMVMDEYNSKLYGVLVRYETGSLPDPGSRYVFKNNYYFFCGDNVLDSRDSRYFGLVPEDYVVGISGDSVPH